MTDTVAISIVTSISAVLVSGISAYFAFRAKAISQETHKVVNSRMTEFMEMAKKSFRAEGALQEKTDEKVRKADAVLAHGAPSAIAAIVPTKLESPSVLNQIEKNTAETADNTARTEAKLGELKKK